jgi:uncharacterized protein (DUF433 family)
MDNLERIVVNPEICLGQSTVRGTRITINVILKLLGGGKSIQEVMAAYPEVEEDDLLQLNHLSQRI